jgi:hypothetical protein
LIAKKNAVPAISSSGIWLRLIQLFFLTMLVLPTTFQLQRGILLATIFSVACVVAFQHWRVHQDILILWAATMTVGALGITWGALNAAPGALSVTTVYFIWPAVYLVFIGLAHELVVIKKVLSALLLGIALATLMALVVLTAGILGFSDLINPLLAFQDAGFGNYDGVIEFRLYNLTTVMFGFPFVVGLLLVRRKTLRPVKKLGLWVLLILILVVALGSGRRMFWLLVLITPVMALFFLQFSRARLSSVSFIKVTVSLLVAATILVSGGIQLLGLDLVAIATKFGAAFQGVEASSSIRFEQAAALWQAFSDSPLIGNGFGSTVDSEYRQGWAFELSYMALLNNVGLLGFLIYGIAVGWIILKGIQISRKDQDFAGLFVPVVTGMTGFLIMNATNPYLGKFDYLWVIFLPVALINAQLTQRPKHD